MQEEEEEEEEEGEEEEEEEEEEEQEEEEEEEGEEGEEEACTTHQASVLHCKQDEVALSIGNDMSKRLIPLLDIFLSC